MSTTERASTRAARAPRPAARRRTARRRAEARTAPESGTTQALFTPSDDGERCDGVLESVPLAQIRLAPNPRKRISEDGLVRLARMMMTRGQQIPAIGRRLSADEVVVYEGQRRFLAAGRSGELAGAAEGFEELKAIGTLCVILLVEEPSPRRIRQLQAHANAREDLTLQDQQEQFLDVWEETVGLPDEDRIVAVCDELAFAPTFVHNLRRQCTLPVELRSRVVAKTPSGDQLSITLANQLADMHPIAPALTQAVAERVVSAEHERQARDDFGAFVHRTVVEADGAVYAQRIDDGVHLDAVELLTDARRHLDDGGRARLEKVLGCSGTDLDRRLEELSRDARARRALVVVDEHVRDRASNGNFAWTLDRGRDYARGVWVVDPVFMIGLVDEQLLDEDAPSADESYFGTAGVTDADVAAAQQEDRRARLKAKKDRQAAESANLALGLDISAGLLEPTDEQVCACLELLMRLLARDYAEVLAFGAGWTDRDRQQPVGSGERTVPRSPEVIVDAELTRALEHRDPLRGLIGLVARWSAAFVLDPNGVTSSKHLGSARVAQHLREALPGGQNELRTAIWKLMAPLLNPHLTAVSRNAFVFDELVDSTTVDLARGRERDLAEVDLGDGGQVLAA